MSAGEAVADYVLFRRSGLTLSAAIGGRDRRPAAVVRTVRAPVSAFGDVDEASEFAMPAPDFVAGAAI